MEVLFQKFYIMSAKKVSSRKIEREKYRVYSEIKRFNFLSHLSFFRFSILRKKDRLIIQ